CRNRQLGERADCSRRKPVMTHPMTRLHKADLSLAGFAETGEPANPVVRALGRVLERISEGLAEELAVAMTEELAQARKQGFAEGFARGLQARQRHHDWRADARVRR